MNKFGPTYKAVEFLGKMIPKKPENQLYHSTVDFLKELDALQQSNMSITISIHANDGIWCYYKGVELFFIKPTQKHILFHIFTKNTLSDTIDNNIELFQNAWPAEYAHRVFKIESPELDWLKNYLKMECPQSDHIEGENIKHPRHIPGEIRQAVLENFIANGRYCNGVHGKIKKHKLKKGDIIEFDHILPHSEGGANSNYNVQILCMNCNRVKAATAK